jgi:hypothetical protein
LVTLDPPNLTGVADRTDDVDQSALEQQRSLQFGWMLMRCRRHGGISQPSRIIFPGLRIFHDLENYLRPHRASFFYERRSRCVRSHLVNPMSLLREERCCFSVFSLVNTELLSLSRDTGCEKSWCFFGVNHVCWHSRHTNPNRVNSSIETASLITTFFLQRCISSPSE